MTGGIQNGKECISNNYATQKSGDNQRGDRLPDRLPFCLCHDRNHGTVGSMKDRDGFQWYDIHGKTAPPIGELKPFHRKR